MNLSIPSVYGTDYNYIVGAGLFDEVLVTWVENFRPDKIAIITNASLVDLFARKVQQQLKESFLITVPDGERYKSLRSIENIYKSLSKNQATKRTLIIGLGGGVINELAGFVATTYLRGLGLIQAPTTVLAMADASVGSKTSINFRGVKNLIGTYKDPLLVLADTATLSSLNDRLYRSGFAEIIKTALISDDQFVEKLEQKKIEPIEEVFSQTVTEKAKIVARDPFDERERLFLNFGHTFAHAFEAISGFELLHGEAVSIGIVAAVRLSVLLGQAPKSLVQRTEHLLLSYNLPIRSGSFSAESVYRKMSRDKKWTANSNRFVILREIGRPQIVSDVSEAEIIATLKQTAADG